MWVISKKAFRFTKPGARIIESLMKTHAKGGSVQTNSISNDCCEVKPNPPGDGGKHIGAFGPPQQIPDWAASDPYFKMVQDDGDLIVIPDPTPKKEAVPATPTEKSSILATLGAAAQQESAAKGDSDSNENVNLPGTSVDIAKLGTDSQTADALGLDEQELRILNNKTKNELFELAASEKIDVPSNLNKADLVAAIFDGRRKN